MSEQPSCFRYNPGGKVFLMGATIPVPHRMMTYYIIEPRQDEMNKTERRFS
jgi:hypothetical protein